MEHRRRTFSNVLEDDIELQLPRKRTVSSIDDQIHNHTEYKYNGTFSVLDTVFCGFLKLICPCFVKKRDPFIVN
jgi:hypothetical protein